MMYSLFIADDENIILRGLRKLIDWSAMDVQIIGEATDGLKAEEQILMLQPDFAILDICMPNHTGLDILHSIRESECSTKVIFLTGHEEFTFAKEAIRYGAKNYLLKPVKKDELQNAVLELLQEIDDGATAREAIEKLNKLEKSPLKLFENFEERQQHYTVLACLIRDLELMEREMERLTLFSVFRSLEREVSGKKLGITFYKESIIYIILRHDETPGSPLATAKRIEEHILRDTGKTLLIGIGDTVSDINHVRSSIDSARDALGYRFVHPEKTIFVHEAGTEKNIEFSGPEQMKPILSYLNEHYAESLSLESVAKIVHMNPYYFSVYFKKNTGMNFKDCLTKIRMEKALQLLRSEDIRTYELAGRVGFSDARYFSELFKKIYGKTPTEFRRDKKL